MKVILVPTALVLGASSVRLGWTVLARAGGYDDPDWMGALRAGLSCWRAPYRLIVAPLAWWRRQVRRKTKANAGWAGPLSVLALYGRRRGQGIPFGTFVWAGLRWNEILSYTGELSVNLIGKTGSGKTSTVLYWLATIADDVSAFFIDVDASLTRTVGAQLVRRGHPLHVIDLMHGASGRPPASYNVFAEFAAIEKESGRAAVIPAMKAAGEALVEQQNELQKTFDNGARQFVVSVIGFVYHWISIPATEKSLTTVHRLICQGIPVTNPEEDPFEALLFEMRECARSNDGCSGMLNALIANGAAAIKSGAGAAGNPFLSSAQRALAAWDLPAVAQATTHSDFLMSDLKRGNAAVGVVCSEGNMRTTYQPLMRLLVTMLEYRFSTLPRCRKSPAVVFIDEAQNLGALSIVTSSTYMRRSEMRLVLGLQDASGGLEAVYGKRAEPILSSAGLTCILPTTDQRTIETASRLLGTHTVREKVEGTPWWLRLLLPKSAHVRSVYRDVERPLKNPEQLRDTLRPGRGRMLVIADAGRPFIAGIIRYWKVLPVSHYAAGAYAETKWRARTRRCVDAERGAAKRNP